MYLLYLRYYSEHLTYISLFVMKKELLELKELFIVLPKVTKLMSIIKSQGGSIVVLLDSRQLGPARDWKREVSVDLAEKWQSHFILAKPVLSYLGMEYCFNMLLFSLYY